MVADLDQSFLKEVNENLGIAHKVLRVYFDDPGEQEDALQEMMYQLWRSYPHFRGKSKFSTWMYKVCLNTALTIKRTSHRTRTEALTIEHDGIADREPESRHEEVDLLLGAISTLNPLNKAIILLYLEDMSYEEIASVVGISRANVSVRLVRIKKELEARLNKLKSRSHVNN